MAVRLLFRQGVRLLIGLIVAALPAPVLSPGLAGGLSCLLFSRLLQPRSARMPAVVASALRRSEVPGAVCSPAYDGAGRGRQQPYPSQRDRRPRRRVVPPEETE